MLRYREFSPKDVIRGSAWPKLSASLNDAYCDNNPWLPAP